MAEKYLTVPVFFMDFLVWSRIKRLFLLIGTKITKSLLSYWFKFVKIWKIWEDVWWTTWWMFFVAFFPWTYGRLWRFFDLQAAAAWATSGLKPPSWRNFADSPYKPYENWICFPKSTGFCSGFPPLKTTGFSLMISEASTVVCSEKDDRICIE